MPSVADPVASAELAAFVAAYESGTVQGAADALTLTQSAVTKRIQALERRLGSALFERGRLGVTPTRLGRTVYPPAKEALAQLQLVASAARAARGGGQGDLRLSASLTIGEFLLPAWLSAFRQQQPGVHPQLEVVNSAGVLAAVRERRAMIGFVEGEVIPTTFEALTVAHDRLVVVVAAGHRWARRRSLEVSDLVNEPYLSRERDSGTRAVATTLLAAHDVTLTPALEVASTQSLKRMIAAGGFSILSRLAIAEEERAGSLAACDLHGIDMTRDLHAIRSRSRTPEAKTSPRSTGALFWAWLETHAAAPPRQR